MNKIKMSFELDRSSPYNLQSEVLDNLKYFNCDSSEKDIFDILVASKHYRIRERLACESSSVDVLSKLSGDASLCVLRALIANPSTPEEALCKISKHKNIDIPFTILYRQAAIPESVWPNLIRLKNTKYGSIVLIQRIKDKRYGETIPDLVLLAVSDLL